jgi:hypothetical protein
MTDEPMSKRRRLHDDASVTPHSDFLPAFLPTPAIEVRSRVEGYDFENVDPFLSPATASTWPFDEFAHDPDYLASQEALRSLLFTTARSTAPTRAGTPVDTEGLAGVVSIKQVLVHGRRVQYLKNYMSAVAPWVSESIACELPDANHT